MKNLPSGYFQRALHYSFRAASICCCTLKREEEGLSDDVLIPVILLIREEDEEETDDKEFEPSEMSEVESVLEDEEWQVLFGCHVTRFSSLVLGLLDR